MLFRNFGDAKINKMLTSQLELKKRYLKCLEDASLVTHGYCVINNSPFIRNEHLRVQFNIFGEFEEMGPFPILYTADDEK